jgi:WD40 repeat protein
MSIVPNPLFSVSVGIPIRSIAWCDATNSIVIGCVGGGLYIWRYGNPHADLVFQAEHTINILRALDSKVYAGVSDGSIKIFDSATMGLEFEFKAHHPIHYTTE